MHDDRTASPLPDPAAPPAPPEPVTVATLPGAVLPMWYHLASRDVGQAKLECLAVHLSAGRAYVADGFRCGAVDVEVAPDRDGWLLLGPEVMAVLHGTAQRGTPIEVLQDASGAWSLDYVPQHGHWADARCTLPFTPFHGTYPDIATTYASAPEPGVIAYGRAASPTLNGDLLDGIMRVVRALAASGGGTPIVRFGFGPRVNDAVRITVDTGPETRRMDIILMPMVLTVGENDDV